MAGRVIASHVLDTCALLDLAVGRWSAPIAREALKKAEAPVILAVSVWEIARKRRIGKLRLPCEQEGVHDFVRSVCQRHRIGLLQLDGEICHRAELLPACHEDSFDRMIIALAGIYDAPVFTTDRRFERYPVKVLRQW